jgi:CubicO group peptidase (beta-lactamase class C family)
MTLIRFQIRFRLVLVLALAFLFVLPLLPEATASAADMSALIGALKDSDPLVRENAAIALGRLGSAARQAVDPLVKALGDEDLYVRGTAAVALGRIGAAAVPALVRALADENGEVRRSAAIALGRLGASARGAIPALIAGLADRDENVRYAASVALGGLGAAAQDAVPALTEALHDRDPDVRGGAALALQQIAPGDRTGRATSEVLVATIDRLVPQLMGEHHVPGVSIALIRDRKVAWSNGYGVRNADSKEPVTPETVFEAASMSKPVFGLLVMQLVDRKQLDLDRPLVSYGAELFVPDLAEKRLVTARMLLSHTSGYPNWRPGGEEREGAIPLLFKPGSRFSYSGEGIFYLQRMVERITGQPLDRWAARSLFGPLGFKSTGYAWTPEIGTRQATGHGDDGSVRTKSAYLHPNAAYTLYTTAEAYARILVEVMSAERGDSPLLSRTSAREMLTPQVRLDARDPMERPGTARGTEVYWGLGFSINATAQGDIIHHSGSNGTGFRCFSQFSPSRGTGIVIMTNGTGGGELWTRLVAAIGDL